MYVLMNKPRNVICTRSDEKNRKTVMDLLPSKYSHLYPVGRLDRNTTGVLLLTNDGTLTQNLLHPKKKVKKIYKAKVAHQLTQEELDKKYGPSLHSTDEQLFQVGDKVCVRHENYATRWLKPHLRTPGYLYGKIGIIERCCGVFPNPEYFAYNNTKNTTTHQQPLYRVRFNQKYIWDHYNGNAEDTIDVEIYQNIHF